MSQIIIITETEEPGAFDSESTTAIIKVDYAFVNRLDVLTTELKKNHPDFSELRLWGSHAEYYANFHGEDLIDALLLIAEGASAEANPSITPEQVEELREAYSLNGSFKWPDDVPFELDELLATQFEKDVLDEVSKPMSVDIEEVVAEDKEFRCAAYSGDQQVYSKHVQYSWLLDEVGV